MRINGNPALLPVWRNDDALRRIVTADTLAIARLEPVFTRRTEGNLALDLIFACDGERAVVPAIRVAHEMLLEPECSPLIWPVCAGAIGEETIAQIERRVVPWLVAAALTGRINGELVRRFSDAVSEPEFERARGARFPGAATYRETAEAAAPYVYAQRLSNGASVGIADPSGAGGAVLLTRTASRVACDLGDAELNDLARRWFGGPAFGTVDGNCDVGIGVDGRLAEIRFDESGRHIVRVATPVPTEFLLSFDVENAPECRRFSVTCKNPAALRESVPLAACGAVGGSSGRILLLGPIGAPGQMGALEDELRELGRRLHAEGFAADVRSPGSNFDLATYDLVHAFDLTGNLEYAPVLQQARSRGIPVVATAVTADAGVDARWGGPVVDALMRTIQDDALLRHHFEMMAVRRLNTENENAANGELDPHTAGALRSAFACVDVLLTSSDREYEAIRQSFGYRGTAQTVAAYLSPGRPAENVDEICGSGDFVLAHAPIAPQSNLLLLARAAQSLELPLLVAGPAADALHYAYLHEAVDGRTIFVPHATEAQLAGLYRRARVFADIAWRQPSLYRVAGAALAGCSILAAERSPAGALWPGNVTTADPAGLQSIVQGLWTAWNASPGPSFAPELARWCDPKASLVTTVAAYAQAQAAKAPA